MSPRLEVQRESLLVNVSPLVAVSKWANECPFVLEEKLKRAIHCHKRNSGRDKKGFEFMYNKNIKPIYNYDLQECNLLFKKNIHPIGCGIGDKDGRVFHVFMADKRYFDAVKLIKYEQSEK